MRNLLREREGLRPEDSAKKFLSVVFTEFGKYVGSDYKIMVVGHNPFVEDLADLMGYRMVFTTGTLFEAESFGGAWAPCFYLKARYLRKA